ncbi:DUF1206 domain-containing protein [Auraticoccus sp. F435]|uniref:DUF1206 domain-containing protein n=1 Tax=Auraticoccus cholistanensis TaxID=2656650 RepID=A0A6A9UTI7_9ACTN|nr:DUF1206 domain-containing protein [Auraticoccus cholistanensis]MVA76246.1 DUF1206 domain-containing protein [Auraticoccus cholistanensis]
MSPDARTSSSGRGRSRGTASRAKDKAQDAAGDVEDRAEDAGQAIQDNPWYRRLVTLGLGAYGVVHLLVAWLALQLALGGGRSSEEASSSGALQQLAEQPFGGVLLVVVAVGLFTLALWQLLEAAFGHLYRRGATRVRKRLSSLGRAVVYGVLGSSAVSTAAGGGGGGGGEESLTARLLGHPAGVVLVLLVAAAVVAVGVSQVVKGVRRTFREDFSVPPGRAGRVLGVVGHVAKGVAFGVVGGLFAVAALTHDPQRAGGLDAALQTVRAQPYGVVLLVVLAAGLAAYGLYCFVWSRHPRHS